MRFGILLAVAACAASPAPRARQGIADEHTAITAFQSAWARDVRPRIADPMVRRIDNRMQDLDTHAYVAVSHECRDGLERVALIEAVRQNAEVTTTLVVYGNPDALLRRERCWAVQFLGGFGNLDAEGWLDMTGRLLIAWRLPER